MDKQILMEQQQMVGLGMTQRIRELSASMIPLERGRLHPAVILLALAPRLLIMMKILRCFFGERPFFFARLPRIWAETLMEFFFPITFPPQILGNRAKIIGR